jgi:hypothetical protein
MVGKSGWEFHRLQMARCYARVLLSCHIHDRPIGLPYSRLLLLVSKILLQRKLLTKYWVSRHVIHANSPLLVSNHGNCQISRLDAAPGLVHQSKERCKKDYTVIPKWACSRKRSAVRLMLTQSSDIASSMTVMPLSTAWHIYICTVVPHLERESTL